MVRVGENVDEAIDDRGIGQGTFLMRVMKLRTKSWQYAIVASHILVAESYRKRVLLVEVLYLVVNFSSSSTAFFWQQQLKALLLEVITLWGKQ